MVRVWFSPFYYVYTNMSMRWTQKINVTDKVLGEYFYNVLGWDMGVNKGSFEGKVENLEA